MAQESVYKQRSRQDRRAVIENDISHGMMSTNGAVDEGYVKSFVNLTYEDEPASVVPRPGLRVSECIFPNTATAPDTEFLESNVIIHATKQCVEDGVVYEQTIIGRLDDDSNTKGLIWVLTSHRFLNQVPLVFTSEYTGPVSFSDYVVPESSHVCYFYTTESPRIHDIFLTSDSYRRVEAPVGCFAYGNSYYFAGEDALGNKGLFRTFFDTSVEPYRYNFEKVEPKVLTVSEAVTHGYNTLLGNRTYTFENQHTASQIQFEGILPYAVDATHSHTELVMTPKKNQLVDLVCYYNAPNNTTYDIVWESREPTASDWTQLKKERVTFSASTALFCDGFNAQNAEVMVRISAYTTGTDATVEKAMVVGFDFSGAQYGTANALAMKIYDITTATGMISFNGRIVAWGLPTDPTILFISDYNEPAYFPYPNNIVTFDEPIIYAIEFMDSLVVFTMDKIYQVTQESDGNTWKSTVIQSHLSIDAWDKHLIKPVRNMLYFKSGNYYYMIVPKARSTTGDLTIAPITTPVTSFFDRFSVSVQEVLKYTYGYDKYKDGLYELLTYYNFLDYDDVHNIYAYRFDRSLSILHFDVIYNTNTRTWRVWVFESSNLVFPFRQESTRPGTLATTSLVRFENMGEGYITGYARIIQLFVWDNMLVRSCYIPHNCELVYNPDNATASVDGPLLYIDTEYADIIDESTLRFVNEKTAWVERERLVIQDSEDFYMGYSKTNILQNVRKVYNEQDEYYTFKNYQFLDTGYRKDNLHLKKRYREIQLQINNLDKMNMKFGMDYVLDGSPRRIFYKYDSTQAIDEFDPEYGVVYVDSTPFLETYLEDIDISNQWTIDQELIPEVSLWKVRVAVSGKGYAPRLRFYSRNEKRFELLSINWVSKVMHMR